MAGSCVMSVRPNKHFLHYKDTKGTKDTKRQKR